VILKAPAEAFVCRKMLPRYRIIEKRGKAYKI